MAHSFFGNYVRIESFAHLWVKEAFASMIPVVWAYECEGLEMGDFFLFTQFHVARNGATNRPTCCSPKAHADELYTRLTRNCLSFFFKV
jgi:hypothetical protein